MEWTVSNSFQRCKYITIFTSLIGILSLKAFEYRLYLSSAQSLSFWPFSNLLWHLLVVTKTIHVDLFSTFSTDQPVFWLWFWQVRMIKPNKKHAFISVITLGFAVFSFGHLWNNHTAAVAIFIAFLVFVVIIVVVQEVVFKLVEMLISILGLADTRTQRSQSDSNWNAQQKRGCNGQLLLQVCIKL